MPPCEFYRVAAHAELRSTGQLLSVWTVPQSLEKIDEWIQAERAHAADLPAAQNGALVGNFPLPRSQRVTLSGTHKLPRSRKAEDSGCFLMWATQDDAKSEL